jgi:hypothetical protein
MPFWKHWWFWVGLFVLLSIGGAISGDGEADNATPSPAQPIDVSAIPIFGGESGGQVVALVNNQGIVSAQVLGELPLTCKVSAGEIVKWDKPSSSYQDTGQVANDVTGEAADSLMATFFGPIGTGDKQGYVFHADMNLQQPYPNAIVVTLDCTY